MLSVAGRCHSGYYRRILSFAASGKFTKCSLLANCIFKTARGSQDKFDHCSCSQKKKKPEVLARMLANARKDHLIPLETGVDVKKKKKKRHENLSVYQV